MFGIRTTSDHSQETSGSSVDITGHEKFIIIINYDFSIIFNVNFIYMMSINSSLAYLGISASLFCDSY